jgi:hypothetical protein
MTNTRPPSRSAARLGGHSQKPLPTAWGRLQRLRWSTSSRWADQRCAKTDASCPPGGRDCHQSPRLWPKLGLGLFAAEAVVVTVEAVRVAADDPDRERDAERPKVGAV